MGLRRSGVALLCSLVAAWFFMAEPNGARAQTADQAEATEQLFEAVYANDFAAVQAAVAAGADVEASDRWGMTPMELAIDKGFFEIGHYLVAVRNFSRAKADSQPKMPIASGSPFSSASSNDSAATAAGPASPLGPLSKPADTGGAITSSAGNVDLETSAGDPAWPQGKANPFDPNAQAHGAGAFTVGEVRTPDTGLPEPAVETAANEESDDGNGTGFSNPVVGIGGDSRWPARAADETPAAGDKDQ